MTAKSQLVSYFIPSVELKYISPARGPQAQTQQSQTDAGQGVISQSESQDITMG